MRKYFILSILLAAGCVVRPLAAAAETAETLRRLLHRGTELFDAGRWSDARHEFLRARGILGTTGRYDRQTVDYYLAACAVELGDPEAEAALRSFVQQWPASVYGNDVRFSLASWYCTQGGFDAAAREFAAVDYGALSPRRREQYDIRMGYAAFVSGRRDEAYRLFDRIGSGSEYADHALYYKSYIDYAAGRSAEARRGFAQLASGSAYAPLVPYYLLQLEFADGNYPYVTAHGEALAAGAVPHHRVGIYRILAESWYRLGEYDKTVSCLDAYLRDGGEPGRDEHYLRGYALYRTARYAEAEASLRRASGPNDALTQNASYHLADCFVRRGAKREAMQAFAMAAEPTFDPVIAEDALFNYGKLQYELGGGVFNEAINVLGRYLERYPDSPRADEARELLVAAYYNSCDYDAAYAAIKACPLPDANLRAALQKIAYFRGLEAYGRGDRATAKRLLAESAAVGVSPKYNALALFWQGEIAYAEQDYPLAASRFEAYLRRAPRTAEEYPFAWYDLGYARFAQEQPAAAGADFRKFLALHTHSDAFRADALNRAGDARFAERAYAEALACYDQAAAWSGPERHYARYQRAVTLGLLHRTEEKIAALERIVKAGEGEYADDAAYELGRTYIAGERYAEGARVLERFTVDHPRSPLHARALSGLGLAYLNLGDRERSLRCYERAVAAAPHSAEAKGAMEGIRDIYVSQGDVGAYFDYAAKTGLETDVSAVARDSLTFAAARQLYLDGRHAEAARALSGYAADYPKGYYMTDALYYLGDSYLRLNERAKALDALRALCGRGTHAYTAVALERLAEMTAADGLHDEAAGAYRRLYDAVQEPAKRERAATGYVRATLAAGDSARVAPLAAEVAALPDAGAAAVREAQFALAEQLRRSGDTKGAMKIYRVLAGEVRSPEGAAAGYYTVKEVFDGGDMAKAEKAAFDYIDRATPHAGWLARAYLLLGDIYAARGEAFQARATWQSVADGYSPADDGIVDEARRRIAGLN